jgi:UDP-GlcNAc:undecaprenyl-phosphate/decaprenyl-phosphate GlcNAc-1-phosphate transferase
VRLRIWPGENHLILLYLGIFAASVLLSFILTRYVRNVATARGWVSPASTERHLHSTPLPRLGGVAIFLTFTFIITSAAVAGWLYPSLSAGLSPHTLVTMLVPGILIFLLGVYDDIRSVGPYAKFAIQALAATMLFAGGLRILDLPVLFGNHPFPWFVGLPVTILWVVAITNAFNLIDGLDGLAAGSALFSTLVVFVVAVVDQSSIVSMMSLALAGATLGFLRFNFNPATIFLGDGGSQFIGFMLAALALRGAQKAPTIIAVAIPLVSFGLPILETSLSVVRRLIGGRPIFTADREHIHHKLLQRGLSHRQVVIVLYGVSALFALLSLFLLWPSGGTLGLVLLVLGTGIWMGIQHLGYLEFGELRRVAQRTIEQRQIFINNLSIRRAIEELSKAQDVDQLCRILAAAFGSNDFDAFELRLQGSFEDDVELPHWQDAGTRGERNSLCWRKPGSQFAVEMTNSWSLTLDLVTANSHYCGSMVVYRLYSERNLQLDINMLTSAFPLALANALTRIRLSREQTIRTGERASGMLAAQAG